MPATDGALSRRMKRVVFSCLLFVSLAACSKKKTEPPAVTPPPAASTPVAASSPSTSLAAVQPAPSAAPDAADEAIESDFTLHEDLALPEGKALPLPKITPAAKEALPAHAAAIQAKFEEINKLGFKQVKRFNASWIPATYIVFEKPAKKEEPAQFKMLEVEGEWTNEVSLDTADAPFDLWNTPRGYFIDVTGDDRLTYFLRRTPADGPECVGKVWNMNTGKVEELKEVPEFVTRARDVDGDGKQEFPTAIFGFELPGFVHATMPPAETLCNVKREGKITIDVVGVDRAGNFKAFYEKRLKAARARALKAQKLLDDPRASRRKKGNLRFTHTCALDVAQAAAEVFVYDRLLGTGADTAIVDADAAMKGFALKPEGCEGITSKGGDASRDQWPAMRDALIAWKPPQVSEQPAPAPSP